MTEVSQMDESKAARNNASVSVSNLKHALKITGYAVGRTSTLPILQSVRMEQIAAGLALESTNLDLFIRVILPELAGPQEPLVLPAEKLMAWVKLLDGQSVQIGVTGNAASGASARATLKCGRARATLPILPAKSWPSENVYGAGKEQILLSQGSFARALRFAMIAVSTEESRYTLNGIEIEGDGEALRFISTDGHRLMIYTISGKETCNVLMPSMMVKALLPLLGDQDGVVNLSLGGAMLLASIENDTHIQVAGKKILGQFPNWKAVYPKEHSARVTVDASEMLASLERCILLADENSSAIDMRFGAQITMTATSNMHGEAVETVSCQNGPKEEIQMYFQGVYLAELLKKLSGEVTLALPKNTCSAILIEAAPHEGESLGYVVMPLRR